MYSVWLRYNRDIEDMKADACTSGQSLWLSHAVSMVVSSSTVLLFGVNHGGENHDNI